MQIWLAKKENIQILQLPRTTYLHTVARRDGFRTEPVSWTTQTTATVAGGGGGGGNTANIKLKKKNLNSQTVGAGEEGLKWT